MTSTAWAQGNQDSPWGWRPETERFRDSENQSQRVRESETKGLRTWRYQRNIEREGPDMGEVLQREITGCRFYIEMLSNVRNWDGLCLLSIVSLFCIDYLMGTLLRDWEGSWRRWVGLVLHLGKAIFVAELFKYCERIVLYYGLMNWVNVYRCLYQQVFLHFKIHVQTGVEYFLWNETYCWSISPCAIIMYTECHKECI